MTSPDLLKCPACSGTLAKTANSCPHCGAVNSWIHPEIQRFLDSESSLKLPAMTYEYGREQILFTSEWFGGTLHIDFGVMPPGVTTSKPASWKRLLVFFGLNTSLDESAAGTGRSSGQTDKSAAGPDLSMGRTLDWKTLACIGLVCFSVLIAAVVVHDGGDRSTAGVPGWLFDPTNLQREREGGARTYIAGRYTVNDYYGISNYHFREDGTWNHQYCLPYGEVSERRFSDRASGRWTVSEARYSDSGKIYFAVKMGGEINYTQFVLDRDHGLVLRDGNKNRPMTPGTRTACQ